VIGPLSGGRYHRESDLLLAVVNDLKVAVDHLVVALLGRLRLIG
jgi:hypothetical protein